MIDQNQWFYFVGGRTAKNIEELVSVLNQVSAEEFTFHVNGGKNDFANWVSGVFKEEELAAELRTVMEKRDTMNVLRKFLYGQYNELPSFSKHGHMHAPHEKKQDKAVQQPIPVPVPVPVSAPVSKPVSKTILPPEAPPVPPKIDKQTTGATDLKLPEPKLYGEMPSNSFAPPEMPFQMMPTLERKKVELVKGAQETDGDFSTTLEKVAKELQVEDDSLHIAKINDEHELDEPALKRIAHDASQDMIIDGRQVLPKQDSFHKSPQVLPEHRFIVKEFIYGFVVGLIFGLIMLGTILNLKK